MYPPPNRSRIRRRPSVRIGRHDRRIVESLFQRFETVIPFEVPFRLGDRQQPQNTSMSRGQGTGLELRPPRCDVEVWNALVDRPRNGRQQGEFPLGKARCKIPAHGRRSGRQFVIHCGILPGPRERHRPDS